MSDDVRGAAMSQVMKALQEVLDDLIEAGFQPPLCCVVVAPMVRSSPSRWTEVPTPEASYDPNDEGLRLPIHMLWIDSEAKRVATVVFNRRGRRLRLVR